MYTLWLVLSLITIFLCIRYHWSRRRLYMAASKYHGPWPLPIFGNALIFNCKNEEILQKIYTTLLSHKNPMRFWLGPKLLLVFSDANHVEKILSSSKLTYKHDIYDFLKCILGEGLVTGSGPAHKSHRKIIQPMFNINFCADQVDVLQKHINKCMMKLDNYVGREEFDLRPTIHNCVVDIIGEVVLGYDVRAQDNQNVEYIQAFIDVYDHGFTRMLRPWLHPNFLYNLTELKKKELGLVERTHEFMSQALTESWKRRKLFKPKEEKPTAIIDQIADYREENPEAINKEDFLHHLMTLYAASEDTITIISTFVCLCLGMYPEYQEKVAEEIREVFGEKPRAVTYDDISKLPYLDMCIKDVLRIIPIAPYILRRVLNDLYIDNWWLPQGSAVLIPIYNLHRDERYWENPFHFHPDHFLPEAVKKRHIYAYVPFSAGPRSCIGKIFANVSLKLLLANLLQRYEFEAAGKLPELKLRMDISVRPVNGYKLKIKQRFWK